MSSPSKRNDDWTIGERQRGFVFFLGRAADFLPLILLVVVILALAVEGLQDNVAVTVFGSLVLAVLIALAERFLLK